MNSYVSRLLSWTTLNSQGTGSCGASQFCFYEIPWLGFTTSLCGHLHLCETDYVITGQQNGRCYQPEKKQLIEKVPIWNEVWETCLDLQIQTQKFSWLFPTSSLSCCLQNWWLLRQMSPRNTQRSLDWHLSFVAELASTDCVCNYRSCLDLKFSVLKIFCDQR